MEKILFEEVVADNRSYTKTVIFAVVVGWICCACFLAMAITALCFIPDDSALIWMSIPHLVCGIWTAYLGVLALCSRRQYIRIFGDRIVYRKQFQKTEHVIHLRPQDYKVRLYRTMYSLRSLSHLSKSAIEFVFLDANGSPLLSYLSPTLHASRYQSSRHKWEDDLLSLGCEIIDYEKIIVNK